MLPQSLRQLVDLGLSVRLFKQPECYLAHALHEVQVEIGNDMGEYELIYRRRMPANPPSSSEAAMRSWSVRG